MSRASVTGPWRRGAGGAARHRVWRKSTRYERGFSSRPGLAVSLAVVAASGVAWAQEEKPSCDPNLKPQEFFDRGKDLYREGDIGGALTAFGCAKRLERNRATQRSIGLCHEKRGDLAGAYQAYTELLEEHGDSLTPAQRRPLHEKVEMLKRSTGLITVAAPGADAEVTIDGEIVSVKAGQSARRVNVGRHSVTVSVPRHRTWKDEVSVYAGETASLRPQLPPLTTGKLSVVVQGSHRAVIWIDGASVGVAPWEGELPQGSHVVEVRGEAAALEPQPVTVEAGETRQLDIEMVSTLGTVRVEAADSEAQVIVGAVRGKGTQELKLPPGTYDLVVRRAGFEPHFARIEVKRGQTVRVPNVVLTPSGKSATTPATATASAGFEQRTWGWVALGAGAAGLLVGGVTHVMARGEQSDLEDVCEGDRCPPRAQSDIDRYERLWQISLAGFVVGGLGAAAGATLLLTAPQERPVSAGVQPWIGIGSAGVKGVF